MYLKKKKKTIQLFRFLNCLWVRNCLRFATSSLAAELLKLKLCSPVVESFVRAVASASRSLVNSFVFSFVLEDLWRTNLSSLPIEILT